MKALLTVILLTILAYLGYSYLGGDQGRPTAGATATAGTGNPDKRPQREPELVVVATVETREIVDSIESIGTTEANESVTLTAKVTDTVSRIHFNDGEFVTAGDILVEMTNTEESALLAEASANLDESRRQLERQQDLAAKGLAAKSTLDEALSRASAAEARFDAITARLDDRLIRAPFSGLLGFRRISPGTLLTNITPITTLDDISTIKLDFSIPEVNLGRIRPDAVVIARSDAWRDQEFSGRVTAVDSRIDPVTRAATVRAQIDNSDNLLRPGMLLTVKIITDTRLSLVIPESAYIQTGMETYVYLAGDDGRAHRQLIRVGSRRYGYVEVLEGLKEGDRVITEGGFKLQDGSPFRIEQAMRLATELPAHS